MRWLPILFLLLVAAHGSSHQGHHPRISNWHMSNHDGSSPRDFGRSLRQFHPNDVAGEHIRVDRIDRIDMGNGARVGFGFVQGRHIGFKFRIPL
jgi:hypothetical protein